MEILKSESTTIMLMVLFYFISSIIKLYISKRYSVSTVEIDGVKITLAETANASSSEQLKALATTSLYLSREQKSRVI